MCPEDQCNIVEEEYCKNVTRPVCMTRTELDCGYGNNSGNTSPDIANTNFDVTGPIVGINLRNQPLTAAKEDQMSFQRGLFQMQVIDKGRQKMSLKRAKKKKYFFPQESFRGSRKIL